MAVLSSEEVFGIVGEFGRGQKKFYVLLNVFHVVCTFSFMATTFVDFTPDWICMDSVDHYHKLDTKLKSACQYYSEGLCYAKFYRQFETAVSEWELICSDSQWSRYPQILFFFGTMLGNVILGYVGDRFGRKILLQWSAVLLSFFTALCAISVQTVMYMIIRFFCGVFSQGLILGYSIWMFELIGPKVRSAYFSYSHICFAIGCLLLAVMAACITDWRVLMVVISLSTAIPVLVIRKVPESPSWLMVKGRMHEAKESVVNIADANGVVLQPFELKKPLGHAESESKNVLSLFSSTSMAVNTFILLFCWFVICFSFYGVTFSLGDRLGGNRYVNFILSSLLEVPVHLTVISIADKYGRKPTFTTLFFVTGVCLMGSNLLPPMLDHSLPTVSLYVKIGLVLIAKLSLSGIFNVAYFYSAEIFPTEVRNIGLGIVSFASRCGGLLSPLVLTASNLTYPMLFMGLLAIIGGVCIQKLPETKDQPFYDTLEEHQQSKNIMENT